MALSTERITMLRRRKIAAGLFMSLVAGLFSLAAPQAPVSAIAGGWEAMGSGIGNGVVLKLLKHPTTGVVYAGGTFTGVGQANSAGLASFNPSSPGSGWTGFGVDSSLDVYSLGLDTSSSPERLYFGGAFTDAGGNTAADRVAMLQLPGATVSALGTGVVQGSISWAGVEQIVVSSSAEVFIGGDFTTVSAVTHRGIAKWNGSAWSSVGTGVTRSATTASQLFGMTQHEGNLYATGRFTHAGGAQVNGVAVYTTASAWTSLGGSTSGMPAVSDTQDGSAIAVDPVTDHVFLGGVFPNIKDGGTNVANTQNLAKWNGSNWVSIGSANDRVFTLEVIGDYLYAGGNFTSIGGVTANRIARLYLPTAGSSWEPLVSICDNGVNNTVRSIIDAGSGSIYVGGSFTNAGSNPNANRVAKFTPGSSGPCPTNTESRPVLQIPAPGNFRIEKIVDGVKRGGLNGMLVTLAWDSVSSYYIHKVSVDEMSWDCDESACKGPYFYEAVPSMDCWSVGTRCVIYMPYTYYIGGLGLNEAKFTLRGFTFDGVGGTAVIDPLNPFQPRFPPGAPTNVVATAMERQVRVTWTKPADEGTFPITNYLAQAVEVGGRRWSLCITRLTDATLEACTITGLTPGVRYTFDVQALNGAGWGQRSAASNVASPVALEITKSNRYKRTFLGFNLGSTVTFEGTAPGTAPNSEISVWVQWTNAAGVALTSYEVAARVRTNAFGAFSFKGNFPKARNGQRMKVKVMTTTNCFNSVNYQPCDAQSKPVSLRSV
jgi:hypothetical protein